MADNYLERKMEEYRTRPTAARGAVSLAATFERLLLKNRSHRAYDARYLVREDQLRRIVAVNSRIPSTRNAQVLRFRLVLQDEAPRVAECIRLGGALPELHLPRPGEEPGAFVIVCSTAAEERWVDIDLGIAAQSMLLEATALGLNGICIGSFDRDRLRATFSLPCEPLLVLAIGRGLDRIELVERTPGESRAYWRRDGVHYVPKLGLDDLLIG